MMNLISFPINLEWSLGANSAFIRSWRFIRQKASISFAKALPLNNKLKIMIPNNFFITINYKGKYFDNSTNMKIKYLYGGNALINGDLIDWFKQITKL